MKYIINPKHILANVKGNLSGWWVTSKDQYVMNHRLYNPQCALNIFFFKLMLNENGNVLSKDSLKSHTQK